MRRMVTQLTRSSPSVASHCTRFVQVIECDLARDTHPGATPLRCALKLPKASNSGTGAGLLYETVAMSRIHAAHPGGEHPHVAKIHSIFALRAFKATGNTIATDRVDALALELYPSNLRSHLAGAPAVYRTLIELTRIFGQLTRTLCDAKLVNVAHGDIKEDNILVTEDGKNIKLADFGAACMSDVRRAKPRGAPLFSPPEAFAYDRGELPQSGAGAYDCFAADVWAVGVMILRVFLPGVMAKLDDLDQSIDTDIEANRAPRSVLLVAAALQTCAADSASKMFCPPLATILQRVFVADPAQRATMEELRDLFAQGAAHEAAMRQMRCAADQGTHGPVPASWQRHRTTHRDLMWMVGDAQMSMAVVRLLSNGGRLVRAVYPVYSVLLHVCMSMAAAVQVRQLCSVASRAPEQLTL